jgi:protein gp37
MGAKTGIEWTDSTWNPIRGCSRVSEGCRNCYAEAVAYRFSGKGQPYEGLAVLKNDHPSWTGKVEFVEDHLLDPLHWKKPRRIFVNSMSDLFHEQVQDVWIDRIFAVMALAPQHTFQVLTKRPGRMLTYLASEETAQRLMAAFAAMAAVTPGVEFTIRHKLDGLTGICFPNVWLGVSVENQDAANERIPLLLKTPAAIRFISAEPLLGKVDLQQIKYRDDDVDCLWNALTAYHEVLNSNSMDIVATADDGVTKLDWVICGGESGPHARPMHPDWARSLRDQCQVSGVPFFFKQWGEWSPESPEHYRKMSEHSFSHETFSWARDGSVYNPKDPPLDHFPSTMVYRVGKRTAGHILDGKIYQEFPKEKVIA